MPVPWTRLHHTRRDRPCNCSLTTHALIHQRARAKPAPVKGPEISSGGTTEGWTYFLQRWKSYVPAVQPTDAEIPVQLLECKLRRDVTRNSIGPLPIAPDYRVHRGGPSGSDQIACSERKTRKWLGWHSLR